MAFTLIGSVAAGSADGQSITSGTLDTSGADFLVAIISDNLAKTATVLSDSKSNSWSLAKQQTEPTSGTPRLRIYYSNPSSVGSGHTFTATGSVALSVPSIAVYAFAGASQTSPLDQTNGGSAAGSTTQATGSVTPTENNELCVAAICFDAIATVSIDSGFSTPVQVSDSIGLHLGVGGAYIIQTSAGAVNPTWTVTGSSDNAAAIATFKAPASAVNSRMFLVF